MAISYTEKREYIRLNTNAVMTIKCDGSEQTLEGRCINLSASGVLFSSEQRFEPGTLIHINITPPKAIVPPLDAIVEVLRAQADNDNGYAIAGHIRQIN